MYLQVIDIGWLHENVQITKFEYHENIWIFCYAIWYFWVCIFSFVIVDEIFCTQNSKEVLNVFIDNTVESSQYCICKLDVGGAMLDCNNAAYEKRAWFHLECLGLEEDEVVDKEWVC